MNIVCIVPTSISNRSFLKRCIESIKKCGSCQIQILIVTEKDKKRLIKKVIPLGEKVSIVTVPDNCSFAKKNNFAIDKTIGLSVDYYLLINDDAWVKEDFFDVLCKYLENKKSDIIIPFIFEKDGPIIDSFGVEYFRSGYAKNAQIEGVQTTLASASCLLIKKSFLTRIKKSYGFYFNPIFHYYLEDVEFSIRSFMLGAKFKKVRKLIAYHQVSTSTGRKSQFTMYNTYRNVLWVILLTWPASDIFRNFFNILVVQLWVFLYSVFHFGFSFYIKIFLDTWRDRKRILEYREKTLANYSPNNNFTSIFSALSFRTHHGLKIPAI